MSLQVEQRALQLGLHEKLAAERAQRCGPAILVGFAGAVPSAALGTAALACAALAAHLLRVAEPAADWTLLLLCGGGAGAAGFALCAWRHWHGDGNAQQLALRLDAHNGTGGSIRAGMDLALSEGGAFAALAVQDAITALNAAGLAPASALSAQGRRLWAQLAGIVLLAAVALLMPARAPYDEQGGAAANHAEAVARGSGTAQRVGAGETPQVDKPPTTAMRATTPRAGKRSEASASGREEQRAERPSAGQPGAGRSAEVARAGENASAQGDSIPGGAPPEETPDQRKEASKPKPPAALRAQKPRAGEEEKNGATAGQSGSGGGALSAVKSPWSQRDRGSNDALAENDAEERIEDDPDEEEARSGTQPTLKDRRSTTSKDLSISGPGAGGEGRGGPSLPKKARGTGSLVLGVPIPDFVRGLLNPGTTRITHERVQPSVMEAPVTAPPQTRARNSAAPRVPTAVVPARWRDTLISCWSALRKGT